MQTVLDQTIASMALKGCTLEKIAGKLKETPHFSAYCAFLFSAGLYQYLLQYLIDRLKKNQPVPWKYLFALIQKYHLHIDKKIPIQVLLQKNIDLSLFSDSRCLNAVELIRLRDKYLEQSYKQERQLKTEKELQMAKSQKLLKREGELIQELIQQDKKNPLFQQQWREYQYKKAKDVFDEYKQAHPEVYYAVQKQTSPEEDQILKKLAEGLNHLADEHSPQIINDIIVILSSMGCTHLAVKFLANHLDSNERKWMYMELLLEDRQFLKCLNFVEQTFMKTKPNSDTAFALNYAKAQAYYGLKEYDKAKKILQDLISLRPHYRSAKTLLSQWQSEGEL